MEAIPALPPVSAGMEGGTPRAEGKCWGLGHQHRAHGKEAGARKAITIVESKLKVKQWVNSCHDTYLVPATRQTEVPVLLLRSCGGGKKL